MPIKVLVKGLNKVIEFPTNTKMEDIATSIKGGWSSIEEMSGLPMDAVSRAERAKYLGFDTETILTHGSPDKVINEIRKGNGDPFNKFDGLFASKGDISEYGGAFQHSFITQRPIAGIGDTDIDYDQAMDFIKKQFPDADEDELDDLYKVIAEDKNVFDMDNNPLERFGFDDLGEASWEGQRLRGQMASEQGFDAISMSDEFGESFLIPSGSRVRNIDAEFNPAKKDSPKLLAGIGAGAIGLNSVSPNEAQASAQKSFIDSMLSTGTPSEVISSAPFIDQMSLPQKFRADIGGFESPSSPAFINEAGASLKKLELPIIGNPLEGVADYLENFGYRDSTEERLKRAASAGLDLI